ncbi:ACT domain-containing protein [Pseudoroseicyclus aestuarii]|uniref:CASTOR ACT domain-containing protein n=1 Tax=Pseudoroseicyclus aestuarii TaxID=1795041 RepID=A0A318T2A3_9RHOB|nr:ACT domain-containing protein [Pseudoroseicyclus aestuarii]PYE84344.1 hypothetical protein DFP88_102142 [Pseudoroseicyclus aestuarii]
MPPKTDRRLTVLPGLHEVVRLPAGAGLPDWLRPGPVWALIAEPDETTVLCPAGMAPPDLAAEGPFTALRVEQSGPIDAPGVVASVSAPIARAGLGLFVLSTASRDLVLIAQGDMPRAASAWREAGYTLSPDPKEPL